ncbi:MAG: hypothetical protein KDE56_12490, partial [Anaerolineales bacterium]|nr:hypothetical protein [Anaerolineales bacterium]
MRKLHSGSTLGSKLSGRKHIELVDFPMANIIGVGTEMFTHIDIVGDVAPFNLKFVKILDDLRKRVQTVIRETNDLRLTEDDRNTYLKRLMHCGRAAYNKFLPHDLTTHLRQLDAEHQARGLQLTFQTQPTMNLFWEMLYA